jgi:hypothetical protein
MSSACSSGRRRSSFFAAYHRIDHHDFGNRRAEVGDSGTSPVVNAGMSGWAGENGQLVAMNNPVPRTIDGAPTDFGLMQASSATPI